MKRINLLPPEQKVKASRERGLMFVVVFLVAVVVVLGLVYFQQHSQVSSKQDELAGLQAQTAAVQAQAAALAPYAQIEAVRTAMTQTTKSIYDSRIYWSTIFEEVSLVIPDNVRLNTMNCTVPATMLPGAASGHRHQCGGTADVTFTGLTYTPEDVATFMTRLGLIPQLSNVTLTTSSRTAATTSSSTSGSTATPTPAATTYRWSFTVTATLRPYVTAPPTTTLTEVAQ